MDKSEENSTSGKISESNNMKFNKKKALQIFLGSRESLSSNLILTPISEIYKEIKKHYLVIKETKGWWYFMKLSIDSEQIAVIKVPHGSHIRDCLEVINPEDVKRIIFFGYCGSLNQKLEIGNVVMPKISIFRTSKIESPLKLKNRYTIASSSHILLKMSTLKKMRGKGIDFLDMETYYLYRWGKKNNVSILSILIVTDQPLSRPFFLCGKSDIANIKRSIVRIVKGLKKNLDFRYQ